MISHNSGFLNALSLQEHAEVDDSSFLYSKSLWEIEAINC